MKFSALIKIVLVGAAMVFVFNSPMFAPMSKGVGPGLMWAALAVQPLIVIGILIYAFRHALLIGGARVPISVAFKAVTLAQGLNLILPARSSEILKATYLRDHADVPLSAAMSAIVLERTVDILIVAALGTLGLSVFLDVVDYRIVLVLTVMGGLVLVCALFPARPVQALTRLLPWGRFSNFVERVFVHFSATVRSPVFYQAFALGILGWGIAFGNIYLFMRVGGNIPVEASGILLIFVLTTIGSGIPALPGGLGTYEAGAVVALKAVGYSFGEALPLAIVLHATQLVLPLLLALVILTKDRMGLSSLIADLRTSMRHSRDS
ncbi:MAG: flippase-like domain-containing protein [Betaproteobacteria bacterium]|nr:flippase-like domain-containing protein [Betaproteobacteria bacterium]